MDTLKDLRIQAHMSVSELARVAGVDRSVVIRAELGLPVREVKIYAVVEVLAQKLHKQISLKDVRELTIVP